MNIIHEFETTLGDEINAEDLSEATYKVVETIVSYDKEEGLIFTHRIELIQTDDQLIESFRRNLEEK